MALDLWKFDELSLLTITKEQPNIILKEQADLLEAKTHNVIYGRLTNMKFHPSNQDSMYKLATVFDIVVPSLDNYSYTLLILYSEPERDYPVAITVGSNIIDDAEYLKPNYELYNKEEFISTLEKILSSDEINNTILTLYSKANVQNS